MRIRLKMDKELFLTNAPRPLALALAMALALALAMALALALALGYLFLHFSSPTRPRDDPTTPLPSPILFLLIYHITFAER